MAKFRKRSRSRRFFAAKRTRRSNGGSSIMPVIVAGGYGAIRAKAAQLISPLTNMIPLGGIADEVALMASAEVLKRTIVKGGIGRQLLTTGQLIEAASIGQAIALGQVSMQPGGNSGGLKVYS